MSVLLKENPFRFFAKIQTLGGYKLNQKIELFGKQNLLRLIAGSFESTSHVVIMENHNNTQQTLITQKSKSQFHPLYVRVHVRGQSIL